MKKGATWIKSVLSDHISKKQFVTGLLIVILTASPVIYLALGSIYHGKLPERWVVKGDSPFVEARWEEKQYPDYDPKLEITNTWFESDRKVYEPGNNVTIHFKVWNGKELPYNVSVDWLIRKERIHGWSVQSREIYNVSNISNPYYSWYEPQKKGDWRIQIIVKYRENGEVKTDTKIRRFEVI